jgi:predicted metalloprotease with PDZ domain
VTLDDYMRAMWRVHGKPGGPQPGLVAKPYTLSDARDRLAEVSGDREFADDFFRRYVEGREVPDYAALLARAGFLFRRRAPGSSWIGEVNLDANGAITNLVPWGSPAFAAGLDQGDVILEVNGQALAGPVTLGSVLKTCKPGDKLAVGFRRRGGATGATVITVAEDPALEAVPVEAAGGPLTPEQRTFRAAWLAAADGHGATSR